MRTLVVQREVALARNIAAALIEAGHDPMVVHDAAAGIKEVIKGSFGLIVLDVGRRQADTFEVLRQLRAQRVNSSILILSARSEITDRVTALQSEADDYLSKPFAMSELIARANALGRRYFEQPRFTLRIGDLTVDLADHQCIEPTRRSNSHCASWPYSRCLCASRGARSRAGSCMNVSGSPVKNTTQSWWRFSPSKVTRVLPNSCRNKANFRADEQIAVPQIPSNKWKAIL
jgi:two-component system OmpR family response regulator